MFILIKRKIPSKLTRIYPNEMLSHSIEYCGVEVYTITHLLLEETFLL